MIIVEFDPKTNNVYIKECHRGSFGKFYKNQNKKNRDIEGQVQSQEYRIIIPNILFALEQLSRA